MDAQRRRGLAMVFVAGLFYSTAGLFTRLLHLDAWTILAWRAVFGALCTTVWLLVQHGRGIGRAFVFNRWQWVSIPLIAAGGIFYIFALRVTTVADVMVIYATLPFVAGVVAWLWGRDVPSLRMMVASCLALVGVGVMVAGGFGSGDRLLGAALTFLMNIAFSLTIVGSRRNPGSTMALFTVGTVVNAAVAFALAPAEPVSAGDMAILAAFGLCTIGLAMSLYITGARLLPSAEVGLVGIVDVVIGPALVWIAFGENPGAATMLGGAIVIGALVWHLWPELRARGSLRAASRAGSVGPVC